MEMALILFVLAMGLALGWMLAHSTVKDWYLAQVEELETALKWEKAKAQALATDLERVNQKHSESAKATVKDLRNLPVMEMEPEELEKAKAQGWKWVLGLEKGQE